MSQTAKPETCLWACWGVGALSGVVALWLVVSAFPVLATLMFSGGLAVLVAISVSRMFCGPAVARKGTAPVVGPVGERGVGDEAVATPAAVTGPADARPVALDRARGDTPDDLTKIKGIGPKLAGLCHDLGIYHFDQIAAWGPAEVAWMDAHLEGFKGRVTRDDWVSQAKTLCDHAKTDGSKRDKTATGGAA
ncbi:NADH:ubiquinone oxidoreductase [Roseovarius sp.]|uniref:NADH:ubiquinone oxidoreductase n=1 Tax=Roseovarius sp. TaxID=1486281 RepID=UPI0026198093|nr:NADH:ubiquinone oxidoreductase [Roseovarius sp.]MDM8165424.1 NADH:ubiquinone oxidoreductase [Roseovarius sp.]